MATFLCGVHLVLKILVMHECTSPGDNLYLLLNAGIALKVRSIDYKLKIQPKHRSIQA